MILAHLTASTFYGGPERQMLGLAGAMLPEDHTVCLSFSEGGRCRAFLDEVRRRGFEGHALVYDTPRFRSAVVELTGKLRETGAGALLCHGYKASLLGRLAARRAGVPAVAVSRGWTYENAKVRAYGLIDRINLRFMDRVVCVSEGQAQKVRRCRVSASRVVVIPNAIDADRFAAPDPSARAELERLFPVPVRQIVGAVGRLSPEKGFDIFLRAAAAVVRSHPDVGFLLFGDGALRGALLGQAARLGLSDRFRLAGFRSDLDRLLPHLDLLVQSSYTEGMPNVILEACAAGAPVVATAVGGTPEIIEDGVTGRLVAPGDPDALAREVQLLLSDEPSRQGFSERARVRIRNHFTFASQAARYRALLDELVATAPSKSKNESVAALPPEGTISS